MKNLYAGYARADITPDYTVCVSGYGDDEIRRSQGVRDHIYLTCIAVRQEDQTILLFDADLLSIRDYLADEICKVVCPVTGIAADHIFCGATHSHSGPAIYGDQVDTARYRGEFLDAAVKVAQEALADLAPATMETATKKVKGMNFVRHYLMEDGTYSGSNFGNQKIRYVDHALESDPRLLLIRFTRQEKPSIVMMNWQAHNDNCKQVGYYLISSSYTGQIRERFEEQTGMHFAFFQGASGNQNPSSRIEEENHGLDYIDYGHKMADIAIEMLPDLKPVTSEGIKTVRFEFEAPIDHSWDHMLAEANEVFTLWKTVGKKEGDVLGKTYGFTSSYQSRDIRIRAKMGPTIPVHLNAFRIGDMGFVTSPNEVFSTVGLHVRLHGPFENTFIITGNSGYLPCMAAYEYRSYESDTGLYAKGTAEQVGYKLVEMLEEIC